MYQDGSRFDGESCKCHVRHTCILNDRYKDKLSPGKQTDRGEKSTK